MSYDLAVDEAGHAYVTGYTRSPDFPVTPKTTSKNLSMKRKVISLS